MTEQIAETPQMPKTRPEQLEELPIGGSIPITKDERRGWSQAIRRANQNGEKEFHIRTDRRKNEVRVWRTK